MTKGEYLKLKKLNTMNPKIDLSEEADEEFTKHIDSLCRVFLDIYEDANEEGDDNI